MENCALKYDWINECWICTGCGAQYKTSYFNKPLPSTGICMKCRRAWV